MVNNASLWKQCQDRLWQAIGNEWVYKTWVAPVSLASCDAERGVVLRVPSRYVYEYIEHYLLKRYLRPVLDEVFSPGVPLHYTVSEAAPFDQIAAYVQRISGQTRTARTSITVDNARSRLRDGLRYFLHGEPQWIPAYDRIAEWLGDSRGRGLLCVGAHGTGKSLICTRIFPVLMGRANIPVVTAEEMNVRVARETGGGAPDLLREPLVIIDGLGDEPAEFRYMGNVYRPFAALCDAAEKHGHTLVITTALSTTPVSDPRYPDSILNRYGRAVLDRLKAVTRMVEVEGPNLRC